MCKRIELLGVGIDSLNLEQAVGQIRAWIAAAEAKCRYVVTPNVDQVVLLQQQAALHAAYDQASLILADSAPLVWVSRLLKKPLPCRVGGAQLVPALFDAAGEDNPITAFLLGARPGVADRAAANIERRWPGVRVVGTFSPPLEFESDRAENLRILSRIADARPDVLIVGLSSLRQVQWVHTHRKQIVAHVALCAGATIDLLSGMSLRGPLWMSDLGLGWLHRMLREPRRLAARYVRDAWIFPQIVAREWWEATRQPARLRS